MKGARNSGASLKVNSNGQPLAVEIGCDCEWTVESSKIGYEH